MIALPSLDIINTRPVLTTLKNIIVRKTLLFDNSLEH